MKKLINCMIATSLALTASSASALIYDMTTKGDTETIKGAIFTVPTTDIRAGTGLIDPFLRTALDKKSPNFIPDYCPEGVKCEQGYNVGELGNATPGLKEEYETKEAPGHNWNHAIQVGDVPVVTIDTIEYLEFVLDINEEGNDPGKYLSLDELQFFVSNDPNLAGYNDNLNLFDGITCDPSYTCGSATLVWELDDYNSDRSDTVPESPNDNTLLLDYKNFSGSGKLDLIALIPKAGFGADANYITLFNRFGDVAYPPENQAEADFEEWAYKLAGSFTPPGGGPPIGVPEPSVLVLLAGGLLGVGAFARKRGNA